MQVNLNTSAPAMALTIDEAARELRVSPFTLRRWVREGRVKVVHLTKRSVRVSRDELVRLLAGG